MDVADDTAQGVQVVEKVVYGQGQIFPEYLQNEPGVKRTVRIDTKLLAKIETEEGETKDQAAKALRDIIASVGKRGGPGEQVRCVVSVSMLTEGWDANSVTHILGVRALLSQLLCEQVVGRGLRRMNYNTDPETGLLPPEYVDVYGIPFSLIPFKGKPQDDKGIDPVYHRIFSVKERAAYEIRFPVVESYTYDVRDSGIRCDVKTLPELQVKDEPATVYLMPTRGYHDEPHALRPDDLVPQTREEYYTSVRPQQVLFGIAQLIVEYLVSGATGPGASAARAKGLARHQIFPEVVKILQQYVSHKVRFAPGVDERELALEKYARLVRERVRDGITAAVATTEHPLLPVLNRYQPHVTTDGVEDYTSRPIARLSKSHLNAAIVHSEDERLAIDVLEELDVVECYTPNSRKIGMTIPYRYNDAPMRYEPDFVVRLGGGKMLVLEIKGLGGLIHDENQVAAKNAAAGKWIQAVNNAKRFGEWEFVFSDEPAKLRSQILTHAGSLAAERLPFCHVTPKAAGSLRNLRAFDLAARRRRAVQRRAGGVRRGGRMGLGVGDLGRSSTLRARHVRGAGGWQVDGAGDPGRLVLPLPPAEGRLTPGPLSPRVALGHRRPMTSGHYTLKVYMSEKEVETDESWRHTKVVLKPINPAFEPIVLTPTDEGEVRVLAELAAVLR